MSSNSIKLKSKNDMDFFSIDKGKNIVTSFSLPTWNKRRLSHAINTLNNKGYNISTKEMMLKALQIIMTKLERQDKKPFLNRAIRYNKTSSSYENISVRINHVEYNSLHSKKMVMKVSLSYLLDLALRLYLSFIVNLFLQKKKKISTCISYYKKIIKFNFNIILFTEEVKFIIKI